MQNEDVERFLDEAVEIGLLSRFTNREGLPMWGLIPREHDHVWINPDVRANRSDLRHSLLKGEPLEVIWRCAVPGCSQRLFTQAVLQSVEGQLAASNSDEEDV